MTVDWSRQRPAYPAKLTDLSHRKPVGRKARQL